MLDVATLTTGLIVFFARICDVSIGTVRTIVTVQGRMGLAFMLAVAELIIWISVASTVIHQVKEKPLLILFYALGFATGNVVGIMAERKLALGQLVLKVITKEKYQPLVDRIRKLGQAVTVFQGEGMTGPVYELYIVCRRRDVKRLIPLIKEEDPTAFYIMEQARDVSKILQPIYQQVTGWRAKMKKK